MSNKSLLFLVSISICFFRPVFSWAGFDHQHTAWTNILSKNVFVQGHASKVTYKAMKSNQKEFQLYLDSLESVSKKDFDQFSENEKLAFLINAYNAFTVKLIIDHYPVESIKDIGSFLTSAWKVKFFTLLGEKRHLDNIEHDMIRKWFNEPRIHFAVVCASIGCPALKNTAFVGNKLDQQLDEATVNFLSDTSRNRYLPQKKKLELSSIFDWYGKDFVKKYGSLEKFLATRIATNPTDQTFISSKKASIDYLDYDWSLNDQK